MHIWKIHNFGLYFRFLWPCIVSKVWREENQQDATIRCLLLTSISTCLGHHYAHLQENKEPVTAFGVLFWFCWVWLVVVVGRCVVGCEQCSHPTTQHPTTTTILSSVAFSAQWYFSTLFQKDTIFGKELLNTKCVFWLSLYLLSETFLILRWTERYVIENIYLFTFKVPAVLVRV